MEPINILYIDDESPAFTSLASVCKNYFSIDGILNPETKNGIVMYQIGINKIICVKNSVDALKLIDKEQFDIAFIDFKLSDEKGDEVGKATFEKHFHIHKRIIYQVMLTALTEEKLMDTLRAGVFRDFIGKPLNDQAAIAGIFARFKTFRKLENENIEAKKEIVKLKSELKSAQKLLEEFDKKAFSSVSADNRFESLERSIIGSSNMIQRVKYFIKKYSETDDNVLIIGETGTGKDLVAEAIHKLSTRYNEVFKPINCAAIPDELVESTLFGVIAGYPGFHNKEALIGIFEEADGGTVFLDEIDRMSLKGQSKLLRLLEDQKVVKLGETDKQGKKVDVRIIAAIKPSAIGKIGLEFLEDLYGRLASLFPVIPTLEERRDDIPLLVNHFIDLIGYNAHLIIAGGRNGKLTKEQFPYSKYKSVHGDQLLFKFDEEGMKLMTQYKWERNVRELKKFIENIFSIFVENKKSWKNQIVSADDVHRAFIFHDVRGIISKEEQELVDVKFSKRNYIPFSDYPDDEILPIEKRLKLIKVAMRENEKKVLIRNLKEIAKKCKEINDSETLRNKHGLSKIDEDISTNGNTISQFFERHSEKIASIVDKFENEMKDIFELQPYKNKIKSLRDDNK